MIKKLKKLGPGILVSAAFIGPGTITTAIVAGGSFGYSLIWAVVFSVIATILLQEMSARLGSIAGIGVGEAIRLKTKHPLLKILSMVLIVAAIGIGNSAYEAGNINGALLGIPQLDHQFQLGAIHLHTWVLVIGFLIFLVLSIGKYQKIEFILTALVCMMGLIFLISMFLLQPSISQILNSIFQPSLPENSIQTVVALIGTTVVPYNLFLHASSVKEKKIAISEYSKWDTYLSVSLGGVITLAVLICAAVAFESYQALPENPITGMSTALSQTFGNWFQYFLGIGFLAAGFTSSVTAPLAAAYAIQEIMGWPKGMGSKKFKAVWLTVLLVGIFIGSFGIRPVEIILFAQLANGLLLPIIASYLLWIMNDKSLMGKHINSTLVNILGIGVIIFTLFLGLRSIVSVIEKLV